MSLYLDTHVVAWLYEKITAKFSKQAIQLIEDNDLFISPIVELELTYLHETKKITRTSQTIIHYLQNHIGLMICDIPFEHIIKKSISLDWTRDPFDRLIVGHALCTKDKLLTKDRTIHKHCKLAVWD